MFRFKLLHLCCLGKFEAARTTASNNHQIKLPKPKLEMDRLNSNYTGLFPSVIKPETCTP